MAGKKKYLGVLLCTALACTATQAAIIDFDDLIPPGTFGPDSGNGFVDNGFVFSSNMDVVDVSPTGGLWSNGVGSGHSGKFAAINNYGGDMTMTKVGGGTFSVLDMWLNGWEGGQTSVTIKGILDNVEIGSLSLSFSQPWTNALVNFGLVDTLSIIPSGYFLVDDIQVTGSTNVPEPGSMALLAVGLAGLGAIRRRRNAKS